MTTYELTRQCERETAGGEHEMVEQPRRHGRVLHDVDVSHDQAVAMASPVGG